MASNVEGNNQKISAEFRSRLEQMEPGEMVRAIAMPVYASSDEDRSWMTRTERRDAALSAMADALGKFQAQIDAFLASTDGRRLSGITNRLAYVVVEAPAKTILLIAEQPWVSAVLEDQDVDLLDTLDT